MSEQVEVQVSVDGPPVPGLVLKWDSQRLKALVTYEAEGHVQTQWFPSEQVLQVD
ncbi:MULTISPECIES: hypothetical protein [unclassified Nocardioides]|jgi:hypothetical protein|uniref:hypothetical protein n=1 Tax=unclassified Nocardioides TaxID=2615069 RepID=UPI00116F19F3|nr:MULTISPECIES: hypothetical protein [unclassified Nocardioides]TQK70073.1 hypothetical protein FBY23_1842 [Nocardioides sp. SLBN-35]WGY00694.1 hypothetical protein QI633_19390 [Nocardioides sp. QY071]